MSNLLKKKSFLALIILILFYLVTHLIGLLQLPVFADEAIYIRWSQLIIDDLPRYLFFPMNDGKTPLFFWFLAPFQFLFDNQLFAARFVAVLVGLAQMLVTMKIVSALTKNIKTVFLSGFLVSILPFWYFHHRMALTDGLMTLLISISIMFLTIEFIRPNHKKILNKKTIINLGLSGIFFGLSLLTKIPAILFVPGLFLLVFFSKEQTYKSLFLAALKVSCVLFIGFGIFSLLIFVPSFSQLFGRGSDFLFPLNEVLAGKWKETLPSLPVYFGYFVTYMTPTLILLMISGLFAKNNKTIVHVFFWSGLLFVLPIGLMGKIVYPRYLFPAVIYFTLASTFAIEELFVWTKNVSNKFLWQSILTGLIVILISNTVGNSSIFMITSMNDSARIPFVSSDKVQYLTEWSSGHGLYETVEYIKNESKDKTIAIATEGSFGSLPDGLNLYFHRKDVSNIAIDGVGFPVTGITTKFANTARKFDRQWLVINSHRMNFNLDKKYLLKEYCRPFNAPCLQVWDISDVFEDLVLD
jgi:4-amino-4-deoxy-L-arabinose transferase-like glycosyltransferase